MKWNWLIYLTAISVIITFNNACKAVADPESIPKKTLGEWAEGGHCSCSSKRLIVGQTTVRFGDHPPNIVVYHREDGPTGQGALHWSDEDVVSNLEYDPIHDAIYLNGMGWGHPATAVYLRCKALKALKFQLLKHHKSNSQAPSWRFFYWSRHGR